MKRRVVFNLLLTLSLTVDAQSSYTSEHRKNELAYQAIVDANNSHRTNDTEDLLQQLISETEPNTASARSLTYRLAALYYRQLKYIDAEALIAPLQGVPGAGSSTVFPALGVRDGMIYKVQRDDLPGALSLGLAAVPRMMATLGSASMAEEILESAYADTAPGSKERASIESRRDAVAATRAKASLELARLHSAIAELYHAAKQYPQAETAYRAALPLFEHSQAGDPVAYLQTRTGLAILLRTQGNAAAALPLQQAALTEMKQLYPAKHPERLETERELAQLALMLGKSTSKPRSATAPVRAKRVEGAK